MTSGVLLDSHALLWYSGKSPLQLAAALEIGRAEAAGKLFASHISIWEMGVAITKKRIHLVPDLGGRTPPRWFFHATANVRAQVLPIGRNRR